MDIEQDLLEPLKMYKYELKYKHEDNVAKFFAGITEQSMVDVEANRSTCKEYYQHKANLNSLRKKLRGKKGLRVFLVLCTIFGFSVGTILLLVLFALAFELPFENYSHYLVWAIISSILLFALAIFCIVINSTKIARSLANMEGIIKDLEKKANASLKLAKEQMAPLNKLYDWNIPSQLMEQTTPLIKMDKNFTTERLLHMVKNYHFKPNNDVHCSTIFVQSGTIIGNPFMMERDYIQNMVPHTYTGTLVISWTTYARDSKGNSYPVHHTQTLVATVVEPAPNYFLDTCTFYVNEAAPNLNFSRPGVHYVRLTSLIRINLFSLQLQLLDIQLHTLLLCYPLQELCSRQCWRY